MAAAPLRAPMRAPMRRAQAPLARGSTTARGGASLRLVASRGVVTPWERSPVQARPVGRARRSGRVPASVYRRRRRVAGALAVGILAALAWVASIALGSFGSASIPAGGSIGDGSIGGGSATAATYVVQRGDTIWSIAERFARPGEVGSLSDRLLRANGGSQLQVGQALVIPAGA